MAKKYGVPAAVLYRHFQYWVAKNKTNGVNYHDGRTWTYNSVRAFTDQFPYLSVWDIRHAIETLVKMEILIKANYNRRRGDRTTWYALRDEKESLKGLPDHLWISQTLGESHKSICESHKALPNPIPYQLGLEFDKEDKEDVETVAARDKAIVEGKKRYLEAINKILKPAGIKEATTFARILKHLITLCEAGKAEPTIFDEAINWMYQAKTCGKRPKALFVAKVKEQTGFRAQERFLIGSKSK